MTSGKEILTKGLGEGYAGHTDVTTTTRGDFTLKVSDYKGPEGSYHDEWLPTKTGGGQELATTGDETITRLYAGGVAKDEILSKLGISEKDVIKYLINKVGELGGNTRLFDECLPSPDGEWRYSYQITDSFPSFNLTRALETIKYMDELVFVHAFEICKVTE